MQCVWGGGGRGGAGRPRSGLATHSQEGGLLVCSDIVRPGPPLWPDPMIPRESPARCYWRACEAPGASHIPRGRSPGHEGSLFGACVPVSCSSGTARNFHFFLKFFFPKLFVGALEVGFCFDSPPRSHSGSASQRVASTVTSSGPCGVAGGRFGPTGSAAKPRVVRYDPVR